MFIINLKKIYNTDVCDIKFEETLKYEWTPQHITVLGFIRALQGLYKGLRAYF